MSDFETMARRAFQAEREIEPSDVQVTQALARARAETRGDNVRRRRLALATTGACLVLFAAVAIPPSRAAIADGLEAFLGGGDPPGKPIAIERLPDWPSLRQTAGVHPGAAAVLAEDADRRLYAWRNDADGRACLSFDQGEIACFAEQDLAGPLAQHRVVVVSATEEGGQQGALWGLAGEAITQVELLYDSGPASIVKGVRDGFILSVDLNRAPRELLARDDGGNIVVSLSADELRPVAFMSISSGDPAWQRLLP